MIILYEIRFWCAWASYLPEDSPWWMRQNGNKLIGWNGGEEPYYIMDWHNQDFREQIALQCKAIADLDFMDGVTLDCFAIDMLGDGNEDADRVDLVKRIRDKIGEKLLIINGNTLKRPNFAPYINGLYMEVYESATANDWQFISDTLRWAETTCREPVLNSVEVWSDNNRLDENKMRAVTTLSLTHSDGYCLFADPNTKPEPDHMHSWYSFWDTDLGQPIAKGWQRPQDEMYQREYSNGTVIYNPIGNGNQTITFNETRKSAATGIEGTTFTINEYDGDIFTYIEAAPEIVIPTSTMETFSYPASICNQQGSQQHSK